MRRCEHEPRSGRFQHNLRSLARRRDFQRRAALRYLSVRAGHHVGNFPIVMIRIMVEEEQLFCARSQGELHGVVGTRMTPPETFRIFWFVVLRIRDDNLRAAHEIDDLCILQSRVFERFARGLARSFLPLDFAALVSFMIGQIHDITARCRKPVPETDTRMICKESGQAFLNLRANCSLVEMFADEDQLAGARFAFFPKPIPKQREAIVHPVKNGTARIARNAEETF